MNCREFDEEITPAVDNHLQNSAKHFFFDHAARCPGCRRAYEAERFIKSFIHQRLHMVRTPDALRASVATSLSREVRNGVPLGSLPLSRRTALSWSFGLAAVFVLAYLLLQPADNPANVIAPVHADVMTASLTHLAALSSGSSRLQVVSQEPTVLQEYFSGKTEFPVHVRALRDAAPEGALLNEAAGVPFASVLYAGGGETIYIYQTCWHTVKAGRVLDLPSHIKRTLLEGQMYVHESGDGQTMVFWTEGRTLCGAIARMQKTELLEHLALADAAPSPGE